MQRGLSPLGEAGEEPQIPGHSRSRGGLGGVAAPQAAPSQAHRRTSGKSEPEHRVGSGCLDGPSVSLPTHQNHLLPRQGKGEPRAGFPVWAQCEV